MNNKLEKNSLHEIEITSICGNGNGVGKVNGMVVFVKNSAVGDKLVVKLIKVTKTYAVARIESIIQPSLYRNSDGCCYAKSCGGCVFQHMTYKSELNFKLETVNEAYKRIGGLDLKATEIYGAENTVGYRNKAIYPVGTNKDNKIVSGFYASMSHRIIEHENCLIGPKIFTDIRDYLIKFFEDNNILAYNEEKHEGIVRNIYLRKNSKTQNNLEISLTLVLNASRLANKETEQKLCTFVTEQFPSIKTILINTNTQKTNAVLGENWRTIYGDGYINDTLCNKKFRISPASFYQVNHNQAEKLYNIAGQYLDLKEGESLLDLYCGTGTVGICLSKENTKLYGVEIVPEAVKDAKFNAMQNNVNSMFYCLDAQNALSDQALCKIKPDAIVIDPPRKGCSSESIKQISSLNANRIVYISCDVATQARDLKIFLQNGYTPVKAAAVDLFPRTGHVETVVLLKNTV